MEGKIRTFLDPKAKLRVENIDMEFFFTSCDVYTIFFIHETEREIVPLQSERVIPPSVRV